MDINVILDTYINDPKEALVSSFELPLVKDLNGDNGSFFHITE